MPRAWRGGSDLLIEDISNFVEQNSTLVDTPVKAIPRIREYALSSTPARALDPFQPWADKTPGPNADAPFRQPRRPSSVPYADRWPSHSGMDLNWTPDGHPLGRSPVR